MLGRRVKRRRDGTYELGVTADERDVLSHVAGQLREALIVDTDAPTLQRLFPTAYPDDPERDAGYHALVRDELLSRHLEAVDTLQATVTAGEVDEAGLDGFMRACNDLRLVIGTRLDVSEDMEPLDLDDDDAPALAVYEYLGMLVALAVDALMAGLPEEGRPDAG